MKSKKAPADENADINDTNQVKNILKSHQEEQKNEARESTLSLKIQNAFNRVFKSETATHAHDIGTGTGRSEDQKATVIFDLKDLKGGRAEDRNLSKIDIEFSNLSTSQSKSGAELSQLIKEDEKEGKKAVETFEEEIDNTPQEIEENSLSPHESPPVEEVNKEIPLTEIEFPKEEEEIKEEVPQKESTNVAEVEIDFSALPVEEKDLPPTTPIPEDHQTQLAMSQILEIQGKEKTLVELEESIASPSALPLPPEEDEVTQEIDFSAELTHAPAQQREEDIVEEESSVLEFFPTDEILPPPIKEDKKEVKEEKKEESTAILTPKDMGIQEPSRFQHLHEDLSQLKKNSEEVEAHYHNEFLRLQVTVRHLRENREQLIQESRTLQEKKHQLEQEILSYRAINEDLKIEVSLLKKRHTEEIEALRYRLKMTEERKLVTEEKYKQIQKEIEYFHHHVRLDANKIKQRETELEHQLELLKSDSSLQISARDNKILELKKKIDMLEFDRESSRLVDQQSKNQSVVLEEKIHRAMKALRVTLGMLESESSVEEKRQKVEKPIKI